MKYKPNKYIPFKFKESKKDLLILRHYNKDGTISPNIIQNYNKIIRDMLELGLRLSFRDLLKLYNLRRGIANEVDSKCPFY